MSTPPFQSPPSCTDLQQGVAVFYVKHKPIRQIERETDHCRQALSRAIAHPAIPCKRNARARTPTGEKRLTFSSSGPFSNIMNVLSLLLVKMPA